MPFAQGLTNKQRTGRYRDVGRRARRRRHDREVVLADHDLAGHGSNFGNSVRAREAGLLKNVEVQAALAKTIEERAC